VPGGDLGVRVPAAQLPHGRGDDQVPDVPHGERAGRSRGACGERRLVGGVQQIVGPRQENPARVGEPAALRGAVEQPRAQLVLQPLDLPAQRRLREVQRGRGPAEVQLLGHDREVPHQAQVEVRGFGHGPSLRAMPQPHDDVRKRSWTAVAPRS
jgi:hypothetical protein